MKELWNKISYTGLKNSDQNLINRSRILTNRINFIILLLMLVLSIVNVVNSYFDGGPLSLGSFRVFMMLGINVLIFVLSHFGFFKISKLLLVLSPAIIILILPTLYNFVEIESFFYYPIIIIAISLLPQILFIPKDDKLMIWLLLALYLFFLIYLFDFISYFSPEQFAVIDMISKFLLYYKLIPVVLFIFAQLSLFYLRKLNMNFEDELTEKNDDLNAAIDDLKLTQQYLIQSEKMASLGTFTSGVVHEINNPLNYIAGGLEMMLNTKKDIEKYNLEEIKERCTKSSNIIEAGLNKAIQVVKSLVSFSYGGYYERENVTLEELFENTFTFIKSKIDDNIEIIQKYDKSIEVYVYKTKIIQVINNIIDNAVFAIKNNHEKKIIKISSSCEDEFVLIKIYNNGPRIPEIEIPLIFDPFYTNKEPGEGVGLGLSICYSFISEHDGNIIVENKDDGVEFIIKLPKN